jgi:hypothetical protein
MKIPPTHLMLAVAFLIGTNPTTAADPVQMQPLLVHGDWEIAAEYRIAATGLTLEDRHRDDKELVRIKRGVIEIFRPGQDKPTESFEIKVLSLAVERVGVIEMTDKNNGMTKMTFLYRFEGSRLLLCMGEKTMAKPAAFAAKGTLILELMPYQQNRVILACRPPEPKPQKVFSNVAPAVPPPPMKK